jgi:hypothetical protein
MGTSIKLMGVPGRKLMDEERFILTCSASPRKTTESASRRADEKLIAFVELEAVIPKPLFHS